MSQWLPNSDQSPVLEDRAQLLEYFQQGCIGAGGERLIGLEAETLGVYTQSGRAIPYDGPRGVRVLLEAMSERFGWEQLTENGKPLGLRRPDGPQITLEPGGQLELSGSPLPTLGAVEAELRMVRRQFLEVAGPLGITLLGLGFQPFSHWGEIPLLPKERYYIMDQYLSEQGGPRFREMMRQTASLQATFDYRDEAEAREMLRLAMGVSPVTVALFANSPLSEGRASGVLSRRVAAWEGTDDTRCGYLREVFESGFGFDDYVDFGLEMPMMFLQREGRWLPMDGRPFREFLENGYQGAPALYSDWVLHLSGSFLEVRLKQQIEVRSPDTQQVGLAMAVPAFWCGLLYWEESRSLAWELVAGWSFEDRLRLHHQGAEQGLDTRIAGARLQEVASELLRLSRIGLEALDPPALRYLEPLEELVARGRTPAHRVLEGWEAGWHADPARLVRETAF